MSDQNNINSEFIYPQEVSDAWSRGTPGGLFVSIHTEWEVVYRRVSSLVEAITCYTNNPNSLITFYHDSPERKE